MVHLITCQVFLEVGPYNTDFSYIDGKNLPATATYIAALTARQLSKLLSLQLDFFSLWCSLNSIDHSCDCLK